MTRRRLTALPGVCLAALLSAGCSTSSPAVAEIPDDVGPLSAEPVVAVLDNSYDPVELVVEVGTDVTWLWEGSAAHNVVGDGFDSGIQADGEFTHAFEDPGAYGYVCTLHPGMEATVNVLPTRP